jgi:hypothetical protein
LFNSDAPDAIGIGNVELAMDALESIPTGFTLEDFVIISDVCNLTEGVGINSATGLSVCTNLKVLEVSSSLRETLLEAGGLTDR